MSPLAQLQVATLLVSSGCHWQSISTESWHFMDRTICGSAGADHSRTVGGLQRPGCYALHGDSQSRQLSANLPTDDLLCTPRSCPTLVLFQSQMNSLPSPSPLITKRLSQLKATWHA